MALGRCQPRAAGGVVIEPERTPDEWRSLLASMRVAGAPDPHPERTPAVRRTIQAAWDDFERTSFADRQESRRVMRTASNADRAYVASLLSARFRVTQ